MTIRADGVGEGTISLFVPFQSVVFLSTLAKCLDQGKQLKCLSVGRYKMISLNKAVKAARGST